MGNPILVPWGRGGEVGSCHHLETPLGSLCLPCHGAATRVAQCLLCVAWDNDLQTEGVRRCEKKMTLLTQPLSTPCWNAQCPACPVHLCTPMLFGDGLGEEPSWGLG